MGLPRIKNVIIIALLLVNLLFAGIIVSDVVRTASVNRQQYRDMAEIMEQRGIKFVENRVSKSELLSTYTTERDYDNEAYIADTLIGANSVEDQGGNIFMYVGDNAKAYFRGGNVFEIYYSDDRYKAENDPVDTAKRILSDMKVEYGSLDQTHDGETDFVSAVCTLDGVEAFNCTIEFAFEDGVLSYINGTLTGKAVRSRANTELITPLTAIVRFMDLLSTEEYACGEIYSVEQGYISTVNVFGDGSLEPAWEIRTDSGSCYINASNGDIIKDAV